MSMTMKTIIFGFALCFIATAASPHAMLDHASPRVGSNNSSAPREVVLWFTEAIEPLFSNIEVRDDKGARVDAGKASRGGDGTQLRVSLKALKPGTYRVQWRVLSVDTHRTQGDFTFSVGN